MANDEGSSPKLDAPITPNPNPSPRPSPRAPSFSHNPPFTPITLLKHRHSVQSSPGHLSLHDYRKLQSSPEAASAASAAAGRTLKRKGKASDLTSTPFIPNPRPRHPQRREFYQTSPSPAPRRKSESTLRDDSDLIVGELRPRNRSFEHNRNSDSRRFGRVDLDVDFSTPSSSWIPHFPSPPLSPLTPIPRASSQFALSQKQLSRSNTYPYHHKPSTSDPLPYRGKDRVTVRHRGVSFEILNPHDSLELFKITTAEEPPRPLSDQVTRRRHSSASLVTMARNFSSNNPYLATMAGDGSRSISHPPSSQEPPDVPLKDCPGAYESILDGSRSAKFPVGPPGTVNRNNPTTFAMGKTFDIPPVPSHLIRPGPVTAQPWYDENMTGVPYGADSIETPPIMSGPGFLRPSKSQDTIQDAKEFDANVRRMVAQGQSKDQIKTGRKRAFTVKRDEDTTDSSDPKGKSKAIGIAEEASNITRPRKLSNLFSSKASRTSTRPLADVTNTRDMAKQKSSKSPQRQGSRQERRRLTKRNRNTRDHSTVSNIIAGYADDSDLTNPRSFSQEQQQEEQEKRETHQNTFQDNDVDSQAIPVESGENTHALDSTGPLTLSEYLAETRESSGMERSSDGFERTQLFHPSHVAVAEGTSGSVGEPSGSLVRAKESRLAHHKKKRREPEFSLNPFVNILPKDPQTLGPAGNPPNLPLPPLPPASNDEDNLMDFSSSPRQTSYGNTGTLLDPNQSLGSMVKGLRPVSGATESEDEEDSMDPREEKDRWEREMNADLGRSSSGRQVTTLGGYRPNKILIGVEVVGRSGRPGILRRSAREERLEMRRSRQSQRVRVPKNVTFTSGRASAEVGETSSVRSTEKRESQLPAADAQMSLPPFESQGSLANYSSCDSLREDAATAWSPLEMASLVPQHPARSSLVYTNRMVNDAQSGRQVLIPEYPSSVGAFPDQNSVTEPVRAGELVHTRGPYHPSVLRSEAAAERRAARWEEAGITVPEPAHHRQLVTSKSKVLTQPMPSPFGGYDQRFEDVGRNVESLDRPSGMDESDMMAEQGTEGSFSKMTTVGEKFNLTGSPNGTGMRAVGSSMADYTSSGNGIDLSSSPYAHQALMARDLRRLRGLPSPHEEIPLVHLRKSARGRQFPEDGYQKATPGLIYQDIRSQRLGLAAEGKAPTLQTSTVDTRLVPVYGAPHPIVHNSETNLLPLELPSLSPSPVPLLRPARMAPAKKQAIKKSKKFPSEEQIRQRIAEFEAVELRDMVNFPSESSLNSRQRPRPVPEFGTEIMADGRPFTSHFDVEAGHWEFSHAPRLINRNDYPTLESEHYQKIWGRCIVGLCFLIPLFAPFLVAIAMNNRRCNEALDVMTRGKVKSFGWEEIKWARVALFTYFCGLSVFAILAGTTHWWKLS